MTWTVPAAATSLAEMAALSCPPLIQLVVRGDPFHCTTTCLLKLDPITVKVKAADPAVAEDGDVLLRTGRPPLAALSVAVVVPAEVVVWQALSAKQQINARSATSLRRELVYFMGLDFQVEALCRNPRTHPIG